MAENINLVTLLRVCFAEDKICMYYRGNFDDAFTDKLILLADQDVEKKAKKRIAILMSESFQNIVRHGNNEIGTKTSSVFGVRSMKPFLHILSFNLVSNEEKLFLEEKLTEINTLDKEKLQAYYMKILEEGTLSSKGGAGLGLIEMAKKSQKPIQSDFRKCEEDVFVFNMQVDLVVDDLASPELLNNPLAIKANSSIYDLMVNKNIIFLYKGDFNDETISPMLNILEGNTDDTVGYRIYHAAVELMQNVVRHGSNGEVKEGIFAINKTEKGYYLCTGNYSTIDKKEMEEYIGQLNSMNKEDLNTLYREKLKASVKLPNNNAGIGLIDLRRSFMTPLEIKFTEDKNGTYLSMGIEIPFYNGK